MDLGLPAAALDALGRSAVAALRCRLARTEEDAAAVACALGALADAALEIAYELQTDAAAEVCARRGVSVRPRYGHFIAVLSHGCVARLDAGDARLLHRVTLTAWPGGVDLEFGPASVASEPVLHQTDDVK
jgi:hypothetical protein